MVGFEKSAKIAFRDLARTSTLPATVSIPQNLPPVTNVLTQTPSASQVPSNQQSKRITSVKVSLVNVPIKKKPFLLHSWLIHVSKKLRFRN